MPLLKLTKPSSYPKHQAVWITTDLFAEMRNEKQLLFPKASSSTTKPFHNRIPDHDHSPSLSSLGTEKMPISLSQYPAIRNTQNTFDE